MKISFVTTCMNRLCHLSQTLPSNLKNCKSYPSTEFIILDYNSSDGLGEWIKPYVGKVDYYRQKTAKYFNIARAKNLAVLVSSGEIVCNIDADNYVPVGFAAYLNDLFRNNENIFATTSEYGGGSGRIACLRTDFIRVKGYNELFTGYGREDCDFKNRCELNGLRKIYWEDKYDQFIDHADELRCANYEEKNRGESMYDNLMLMKTMNNVNRVWGIDTLEKNFTHTFNTTNLKIFYI